MPILEPLTNNKYTDKHSFQVTTEIVEQDSSNFMGSLDIGSLFTNIPLEEIIEICTNNLFINSYIIHDWKKNDFKDLLSLATKESYFIFNKILYKKIDGVAMGSSLRLSQANAFLAHHEQNWLDSCPLVYRSSYYRGYVDDMIVLFKSSVQLKRFQSYLNSCQVNMSFTIETEQNNKISFLDVSDIGELVCMVNQLSVVCTPILIAFYMIPTKMA